MNCATCGMASIESCNECRRVNDEKNTRRCYGKVCYSEHEANNVVNSARRGVRKIIDGHRVSIRHGKQNIPKRKYYCQVCGMFHVTHLSHYKENGR